MPLVPGARWLSRPVGEAGGFLKRGKAVAPGR
jgi:hypothetical protein